MQKKKKNHYGINFKLIGIKLRCCITKQVHVSLSGEKHMRISWITSDSTPAVVYYGTTPGANSTSTSGSTNTYEFVLYRSGEIHDVVIGPLNPNTLYYYRCGSTSSPEFTFKTPPSSLPINFAISGNLITTIFVSKELLFESSNLRAQLDSARTQ